MALASHNRRTQSAPQYTPADMRQVCQRLCAGQVTQALHARTRWLNTIGRVVGWALVRRQMPSRQSRQGAAHNKDRHAEGLQQT